MLDQMLGASTLDTPIGVMTLLHDGNGLLWAAEFSETPDRLQTTLHRYFPAPVTYAPLPAPLQQAFNAYFGGDLQALAAIETGAVGSAFERRVWRELRTIPAGSTRSYAEIARQLGEPGASRAVGVANSRNPLAIVVPCHRVIGADGSLTGYAGGLHRKEWLLRHEGWAPRQERML